MEKAGSWHPDLLCPIRNPVIGVETHHIFEDHSSHESPPETWMAGYNFTFVACQKRHDQTSEPIAHRDAIVISVYGKCPQSSIAVGGIFFYRNNPDWNRSFTMPEDVVTDVRAELYAGMLAIELAQEIRSSNLSNTARFLGPGPLRDLRRVVIKTDSEHLVKGMTEWVYNWRRNGYINSRGKEVIDRDLFGRLDAAIEQLSEVDVEVQFWHVPREMNEDAARLANEALVAWEESMSAGSCTGLTLV